MIPSLLPNVAGILRLVGPAHQCATGSSEFKTIDPKVIDHPNMKWLNWQYVVQRSSIQTKVNIHP